MHRPTTAQQKEEAEGWRRQRQETQKQGKIEAAERRETEVGPDSPAGDLRRSKSAGTLQNKVFKRGLAVEPASSPGSGILGRFGKTG